MSISSKIKAIAQIDILNKGNAPELFVGRPFYIDYEKTHILVSDAWKERVQGIPQGAFLLAFYDNQPDITEALLLRALRPTNLPTDTDIIKAMIEYYKDNLRTSGSQSQLDEYTRYEFGFSGLECRVLGTFYRLQAKKNGDIEFGADVENFYSANNYSVYKATGDILKYIVNQRDDDIIAGNETEFDIGFVRYSSSRRYANESTEHVSVYINPQDFLGKRSALFGMTRTGKSNTVKKIIEATVRISSAAKGALPVKAQLVEPFTGTGTPAFPAGQIIFDINGEYANPNLQDEGTAIFELYSDHVTRYSVIEKPGFKVMKVNFFRDINSGFELAKTFLSTENVDYVSSFCSIDLSEPEDKSDKSAMTRWERKAAAYFCCLFRAGFKIPEGFKVNFSGNKDLNQMVRMDGSLDPKKGLSLEEATDWFLAIWEKYDTESYFQNYKAQKGREWADEELKAILVFLSRKKSSNAKPSISGYRKLNGIKEQHTSTVDEPFEKDIIKRLRLGEIIIVDLSQGNPEIQKMYSERICRGIFNDAMRRFTSTIPNNFVQFYFEEAHNLFPKKDDKDLGQIYNRIAKEGAKLNLGLIYLTQEVSSISNNILKNTQNWFIAHLNNEDEVRELRKYYDFSDFTENLLKFSSQNDKGFVRMKTYSNPFVVPVQINRFSSGNK